MTMVDAQPDWERPAPPDAMQAVVLAAEQATAGRADLAAAVMAEATCAPSWLAVAAVRTLAGLLAGPGARADFDRLRAEAHDLAAATGAPDSQLRLSLAAIALAEAFERGAIGRCIELAATAEFPPREIAHAAASLAGFVVVHVADEQVGAVFAELRRRNGLAP